MVENRYTNIRYIDLDYWFKEWPVEIINGSLLYDVVCNNVVLQLKICNISNENISSVYISVECFDDAGDKINENDNTVKYSYQDLDVKPNNTFGDNVAIPLINKNVRKVNIHVEKVVYKNGDIKKIDTDDKVNKIPERRKIDVLGNVLIGELNRIKLEENPYSIEFIPEVVADVGWICGCGRLNNIFALTCCRCGRDKADQFKIISKKYLEKSYNDYQIYLEKIELKAKKEKQIEDEEKGKQIKVKEAIKQEQKVKRIQIAKITLAAILLFFIIFVSIRYIKPAVIRNQQYGSAIKLLNSGKYDEALPAFEKLKHYKNSDEEIKETHYRYAAEFLKNNEFEKALLQLQQIPSYKDSKVLIEKASYQIGIKLMNAKDYLTSIAKFKKVTKANVALYSSAQKNIELCKKQFIKLNVTLANKAISSKNYEGANKYINELMKIDSNSVDAKNLKSVMANNIARDKVTADAVIKANEVQYASYFNKAFDYTIVYPTIFDRLADQQTGAGGVPNGIIFTTKDKKAQLQIAAFNNDLYPDKSSFKDTDSEMMGDIISYTKSIWGKGSIVMYTLVYPKSQREIYDKFIDGLNKNFVAPAVEDRHLGE